MDFHNILEADEKAIAQRYGLNKYFLNNKNFLLFVAEIQKILSKRFDGFGQADWAKRKCSDFIQEFLKHNDQLYNYVNDMFAKTNDYKNISSEDWQSICIICSKIIVQLGWDYETKS